MRACEERLRAGCPRHRGPGILPGAKRFHMISRLNANIRVGSGCMSPPATNFLTIVTEFVALDEFLDIP